MSTVETLSFKQGGGCLVDFFFFNFFRETVTKKLSKIGSASHIKNKRMQGDEPNFICVEVFGLLLLKYLGCLGNS